ncbi:SDR family NAD(P)-dependent oxidoreductase [Exiguobacterium sp. RIT452]|uniref:SDR family NAD(P)-dependent oxidoreductase n=1 Tax=Exiguobacterium sp. RIT452 TaxID=2315552 RepID=UPI0026CA7EA8
MNNTSITSQIPMSKLNEVKEEVWDSLFVVNVKGMFHCVKEVFLYMKKQSARAFVNLGSVTGVSDVRFFNPLQSHELMG